VRGNQYREPEAHPKLKNKAKAPSSPALSPREKHAWGEGARLSSGPAWAHPPRSNSSAEDQARRSEVHAWIARICTSLPPKLFENPFCVRTPEDDDTQHERLNTHETVAWNSPVGCADTAQTKVLSTGITISGRRLQTHLNISPMAQKFAHHKALSNLLVSP
jgi:hypothetical protein